MARVRRHRSRWILGLGLVGSLGLHIGSIAAYLLTRPPPPHHVQVRMNGPGVGVVKTVPGGFTCTRDCKLAFPPGTVLELTAQPDEASTFLGWSGDCQPRPDHILACTLRLEADAEVRVGFDLMPDRVDVAWVKVEEEKDEETITLRLPDPEIEAEMLVQPLAEILPEVALAEPEPEPEPEPPPQPAQPAQPQPPPPELANMRSVEVPDQNEVEKAPDDATHLSDKNRDVAEETRAEDSNLAREQAGAAQASTESEVQSEEIGGEEDVIAELEESEPTTLEEVREETPRTGESQRAVGAVVGEAGEAGEEGKHGDGTEAPTPGVLSMRGIGGRGPIVASDRPVGRGGEVGAPGKRGKPGLETKLDFEDYERIVGKEKAEEEVAMGKRRTSTKRGRFERKMEVVRSALENFTPEVRPGNQTALKTRAAPFAVFLARMHREIHPLWAFGFLESLSDKPGNHPLNHPDLLTTLEIVINGDGTVHKINILQHSGRLEFDMAALDTVMTASPYEEPPAEIRSPDGRVYLHWGFYRNHRQCGTFNAQPFILDGAPAEEGEHAGHDDSDMLPRMPRQTREKMIEQARAIAPAGAATGSDGAITSQDPEALHATNLWTTGFAQRDLARMLQVSGTPFQTGAGVVVRTSDELRALYQAVLRETGGMREWKLFTPAGYRQRFGELPAGVDPASTRLLAVVVATRDRFVLALEQQGSAYKVVGLYR
ncbi:MAG TPA: energy transducer TonB [Haliangium sp.]|nr:energy transducer TonB [Haliangium sp.]